MLALAIMTVYLLCVHLVNVKATYKVIKHFLKHHTLKFPKFTNYKLAVQPRMLTKQPGATRKGNTCSQESNHAEHCSALPRVWVAHLSWENKGRLILLRSIWLFSYYVQIRSAQCKNAVEIINNIQFRKD